MTLHAIADEVHREVHRAWVKFGPQYEVPDVDQVLMTRDGGCGPLRMAQEYEILSAPRAKFLTDLAFQRGQGTWAHILIEEVAESIEASVESPERLRAELLQVAAVAMRWIDAIDTRQAPGRATCQHPADVPCHDSCEASG